MNEEQALELFAPARERAMPPARFSMAEVYAADARHRRRRRSAAVATTVLVVVAIVATFALASDGGDRGIQPVTTPTTRATSLSSLLDQLQPPADAAQVAPAADAADALHSPYEGQAWAEEQARRWTTSSSPEAALAVVTAHPPAGMTTENTGRGTYGDRAFVSASFRSAETAEVYGPQVEVQAVQLKGGGTSLSALAWELVRPAKAAEDLVSGEVESVVGTVSDVSGTSSRRTTVTGEQARQLAKDVNALWVNVSPPTAGCGAGPYSTGITLDFTTSTGESSFGDICGVVAPIRNKA
jgi:hypothetical protein